MHIPPLLTLFSLISFFPLLTLPFQVPIPFLNTNTTHPTLQTQPQGPKSGNPLFGGWYADPEARLFDSTYWIYPTYSASYESQTFFDAFSSPDLLSWTKHPVVLNITAIPWSTNRAAWAPSVTRVRNRNSRSKSHGHEFDYDYFMFFSVGDGTGIGVARSSTGRPEGPFEDVLGEPLVGETVYGAEAIDAQIFIDDDDGEGARAWLYYGGWSHAVVVEVEFTEDGTVRLKGDYKEITPRDYVEGPWVMKRGGVYYFMYSVGGWGDNSYGVSYVTGPSPTGPFSSTPTKILQGDDKVGTSTGHNSVFTPDGGRTYYIVYHRRPVNDSERDHRVVCVDKMEFDERGNILPVKITSEGVEGRPL